MSESQLERYRESIAAVNAGDLERWSADLTAEFEFHTAGLRGRDALGHITTFDGEEPVRLQGYASWDDALSAAGLES